MANRSFRKNLILALSALVSLFGGIKQTAAIDAVTLYNEAVAINCYDHKSKDQRYDNAVELMNELLKGEKVEPASRKNQSRYHKSTDLAKAKFLYEASKAIYNYARSFDLVSENWYGNGAPEYYLNEIKENAQLLEKLGDLWGWPTGNYVWELSPYDDNNYSDLAKTNIYGTKHHIKILFEKYDNPIAKREKNKKELEENGYSATEILVTMKDYDNYHHPTYGEIWPE